jgi:hypothetical protein
MRYPCLPSTVVLHRQMTSPFPDRSGQIFGRELDIAHLLDRSRQRGITAVVGRPQMGKSWLLMELASRLSLSAKPSPSPIDVPHLFAPPTCLVGTFELQAVADDFLLRAVVDLYSRWLSDSTYLQQAQATYQLQKKDLIGKTGEAVGSIFEAISKLVSPLEGVGKLVKGTFEGLAQANRDLLDGKSQLPQLQIDQARELLELVSKITKCQLVLIFDQWEKSREIDKQADILDTFIRHVDEWPSCHIFLGMRPDEKPRAAIRQLQKFFPGIVEEYDLLPMRLDDPASRSDLLRFLRANVEAAAKVSDEDLLNTISGYPGTLAQWTSNYYASKLHTLEDFKKVASDANANRFAEFETLLPTLSESERRLSIRLVMLPANSNAEDWAALRTVVLEDGQAKDIDRIKKIGVIELVSPPTYGHTKRAEAAFQWFVINSYEELREVCEHLILNLGGQIQDIGPRDVPFATSLLTLDPLAFEMKLTHVAQGVCQAARTLFSNQDIAANKLIDGAAASTTSNPAHRLVAPLLAVGLLNALNDAKRQNALSARDAVLEQMRQLFHTYPDVALVRGQLASGLNNATVDAIEEAVPAHRDSLLDELRQLRSAYPEDAVVRLQLAGSLFNVSIAAKQENALDHRDDLVQELRLLSLAHPDDAAVRESATMAIFNSLNSAKEENALDRRDALLNELRHLHVTYPTDAVVSVRLARGLLNTAIAAKEEENPQRRADLLEELRQLSRTHPGDEAVRKNMSIAVFNELNYARVESAPDHRDARLDELRQLHSTNPTDAGILQLLAIALFQTRSDAKQEKDLNRRDALLEEQRKLYVTYPEDRNVRQWLAKSIANTLDDAQEENVPQRRDPLLAELWHLTEAHPDDAAVRNQMSVALFNSLVYAKQNGEVIRRDGLLDALRHLASGHPEDLVVIGCLAKGFFNVLIDAKEEGALDRRDALLEELRGLYRLYPNDIDVRQWLAKGIARTLVVVTSEGKTFAQEDAYLEELRQLANAHPEDTFIRQLFEAADT